MAYTPSLGCHGDTTTGDANLSVLFFVYVTWLDQWESSHLSVSNLGPHLLSPPLNPSSVRKRVNVSCLACPYYNNLFWCRVWIPLTGMLCCVVSCAWLSAREGLWDVDSVAGLQLSSHVNQLWAVWNDSFKVFRPWYTHYPTFWYDRCG